MNPWPKLSLSSNPWSSTFLRNAGPAELGAEVAALDFQWTEDPAQQNVALGSATSGAEVAHKITLNTDSQRPEVQISQQIQNHSNVEVEGLAGAGVTLPAEWAASDAYLDCGATGMFSTEEDPPLRRKWPKGVLEEFDPRRFTSGAFKRVFLTDFDAGLARWVMPSRKQALEFTWDTLLFPYLWFEQSGSGADSRVRLRAFTGLATAIHDGYGLLTVPGGQTNTLLFKLSLVTL